MTEKTMPLRPLLLVVWLAVLLAACSSPEEKKAGFFRKGEALFAQGDYQRARLELRNALQLDPDFAEAYFILGRMALDQADFRGAYGSFLKVVEVQPQHWEAHLHLGKLLLMTRKPDEALEKAELVLKGKPEHLGASLLKATVFLARGDDQAAAALLQSLHDRGLTDPDLFLLLAAALSRGERPQDAEQALQAGIEAHPDSASLHVGMGQLLAQAGKNGDAMAMLTRAIELDPGEMRHRFILAELSWRDGQRQQAAVVLDQLLADRPRDEVVRVQVAMFYARKEEPAKAEQVMRGGLEANEASFPLRLALGEFLIQQKRTADAVELLEETLRLEDDPAHPGILQTKNGLARIKLMSGRPAEADRYVVEVLKESPKNLEARFTKGSLHLLRGEGQEAVAEFRAVVAEQPEGVAGYLRLADAHLLNRETSLAAATLQKALQLEPRSREVLLAMARVEISKNGYGKAEELLRKALALHPEDLGIRARLGDLFLTLGSFAQAEKEYRAMIQQEPTDPLGYFKLAQLAGWQEQPAGVLAALSDGHRRNPGSASLFAALSRQYLAMGQADEALRLARSFLKEHPESALAYNQLGGAYVALKWYSEAEEAFSRAIELQPHWAVPRNNLANFYLQQGRKAEAVAKFENDLASNPDSLGTYLTLGMLHENDAEHQEAMRVYERALARKRDFWPAANNLAFLLTEFFPSAENLERALRLALEARSLNPGPDIADTLAWVHYRMGDLGRALDLLEEAQGQAPDTPILNYHLGAVLWRLGRLPEARDRLKAALVGEGQFPGRKEAETLLRQVEAKAGAKAV